MCVNSTSVASPSVNGLYGRCLRALLDELGVLGAAEFSRLVYGQAGPDHRRRVRSHLTASKENRLPSMRDHEAYLAALMRSASDVDRYDADRQMRLSALFADLINAWRFTATTQLQGTNFAERSSSSPEAMAWPQFQASWLRGDLETQSQIEIVIDFSGSQGMENGWTLPFERVKKHKMNGRSRESLFIIDYEGRPRMAMRLQRSPGLPMGASPELSSVCHDEILWREPGRRIVEIPDQSNYAQPINDSELQVLRPIVIQSDSANVIFICTNGKR